ncbi:molybdopterin molybdenumtransferase MoeA [bacterium]|nr:MAG: molybdopterin molybdenumtransferase MoeA [bacterium]TNF01229.1 MAG: molybdopterin molybdenumtransferase MoeA [Bacteroidota bacterium]
MISPVDAINKIKEFTPVLRSEELLLSDALGRILSEDVKAPIDMPPFNQSAMDGYALGNIGNDRFDIIGEHKAGDKPTYELSQNEAIRIFTGALVPDSAVAVVKQEDVTRTDNIIQIMGKTVLSGENIRLKGEQIKKGHIAVKQGTPLYAGTVGYLSTLGVTNVNVSAKPTITIITTGSELIKPGLQLEPGLIYESNSVMLSAALFRENLEANIITIEDDKEKTREVLSNASEHSDAIIITGGVSVGDYDFVYDALQSIGVEDIFYKVAQKPGKPLYVGKKDKTMVFGLPGNPAAALTCFYFYVTPSLRKMQGHLYPELIRTFARLDSDFEKNGTLTNHLKGYLNGKFVTILPKQSSAMLGDFTDANCIVILPGDYKLWERNDLVEVMILPQ